MKKQFLWLLFMLLFLFVTGCSRNNQATPEIRQPSPSVNQTQTNEPADPSANNTAAETKPAAKTMSWYMTRNKEHTVPVVPSNAVQLLAQNQGIYALPNDSRKIYLTFDCGYELGYTPAILDTLQQKQVKAAFFITGQYIESQPALVKRMQAEGHLVCNHTWNHPDLSTVSQEKLIQEISSLAQRYEELTGAPMDSYIRPPMGNYTESSLQWTKELGYTSVFWSMAWADWDPKKQPGAAFVYNHVMENIHPGAIILMHAVSQSDTEALERIITDLQAQGYVFSTFAN